MPYDGQQASKRGHFDLIKNPDVEKFLNNCQMMRAPSDAEGEAIAASFHDAPACNEMPALVVASDSSPFSEPTRREYPSTQVGYVNVSVMAFDMGDYNGLQPQGSKFVDPHAVAAFHNRAKKVSFVLPGSNVVYGGARSVQDGFRKAVFDQFGDGRSRFVERAPSPNLLDTILAISGGTVAVRKCPSCAAEHHFSFNASQLEIACADCGVGVYATDALRIHEQMSDFGDNASAITRFMNAAEHLLICTMLKTIADNDPARLSQVAVIIDGPLALFGQPAKFHAPIQAFYNSLFEKSLSAGRAPPLIMGLQKEGQVMDHARDIQRFIRPGTFQVISDEYRSKYITGIPADNANFGHETYYGQDFLYMTDAGQIFDVCLAYPVPSKTGDFGQRKSDIELYEPWLGRAFRLIRELEFDLYSSAIVPVALAHRHASISLTPGGAMLGVLTKRYLGPKG